MVLNKENTNTWALSVDILKKFGEMSIHQVFRNDVHEKLSFGTYQRILGFYRKLNSKSLKAYNFNLEFQTLIVMATVSDKQFNTEYYSELEKQMKILSDKIIKTTYAKTMKKFDHSRSLLYRVTKNSDNIENINLRINIIIDLEMAFEELKKEDTN